MTLEQEFEINNYLLSKIQQKIGILGLGIGYYFIISKVPGIYIILFHGEIKNCFAKILMQYKNNTLLVFNCQIQEQYELT